MDCHLEDTSFDLLGVFKFSYDDGDFMEQLFKHEGYCLWGEDTFEFMETARNILPNFCNETRVGNENIFYDLKPLQFGKTTIGLYKNEACISDYEGSATLKDVVEAADSGELEYLYHRLHEWDKAMAKFHVCQPCVSYDLATVVNSRTFRRRNLNDGDSHPFSCYDYAGANSVNQVCPVAMNYQILLPARL